MSTGVSSHPRVHARCGILHLWAFFWLLNAVENLGLNAETCFTSTRRPNTTLCHSGFSHYSSFLVILIFFKLKNQFLYGGDRRLGDYYSDPRVINFRRNNGLFSKSEKYKLIIKYRSTLNFSKHFKPFRMSALRKLRGRLFGREE